jgi:hypothetical protein
VHHGAHQIVELLQEHPSPQVSALLARPEVFDQMIHFICYFQSFYKVNRFVTPPIYPSLVIHAISAARNLDISAILRWLKEMDLLVNKLITEDDMRH